MENFLLVLITSNQYVYLKKISNIIYNGAVKEIWEFSTLELVEIEDTLEMQLLLKNISDGKEYIIDYPEEQKGKTKRSRKSAE